MGSLSPQVQRSFIEIAGEWSLSVTNQEYSSIDFKHPYSSKEFNLTLLKNFEDYYYNNLTNILGE